MTLPKIGLLDKDFIDEARTESFYESGSWKPSDRDALYKKAYRRMLTHECRPTDAPYDAVDGVQESEYHLQEISHLTGSVNSIRVPRV